MKHTIFLFLFTITYSCKAQLPLQSYDFTPEGSFTQGIEGPATDYDGNIYAVNFEAKEP